MPHQLKHSIYNTVRYFDLLDLPVTATQIWRCLVLPADEQHTRWAGQKTHSLREIRQALASSPWLAAKIQSRWGYYFLSGKQAAVRRRLARHVLAQHKWPIAQRVARLLAHLPLITMIAGSGSLALDNTRPESDLDLLIIVRSGRIWTARLLAIIVTQLTGRRRKHWDRLAPDKICLNHYLAEEPLQIPAAIRNLYTAVAYSRLVPMYDGQDVCQRFQQRNASWMRHYIMFPVGPFLPHRYQVRLAPIRQWLKEVGENLLLEPAGNWLENLVGHWQRRIIARHTDPARGSRVALSATELAFHPDSRVEGLLRQYYTDPGQQILV